MKTIRTLVYFALLLLSLLLSALLWDAVAVDKLFVCTDSVGAWDIIPPFVHSCCGDHYVAPAPLVWLLWLGILGVAFTLPVAIIAGVTSVFRHAPATHTAA